MRILYVIASLCLIGASIEAHRESRAAAQNPALTPSTLTIPATVLHTNCSVTAGQTTYCFAGDGMWISLNGAAWVQVQTGTAVAGVTSWNGLTGAVTYTGVNSVNGKTGAVVISASTTLQ